MTSSVKADPSWLPLKSKDVSLTHSPLFLLYFALYTTLWDCDSCKKKWRKKITASHRLVPAVLMIRWSGLWFISYLQLSSLSLTCTLFSPLTWFNTPKSHSKADAHCTRVCSPPTDGLTDHYNKHLLWSSLIKKKMPKQKILYCRVWINETSRKQWGEMKSDWVKRTVGGENKARAKQLRESVRGEMIMMSPETADYFKTP